MLKQELEKKVKELEAKVKSHEEWKKSIPKVMKDKIEKYDLDLCPEGVADFCNTLGIETPSFKREAQLYVTVSGVELKGNQSGGLYNDYFQFDDGEISDITSAIEKALKSACEPWSSGSVYVDVSDFEEN